MGLEPQEYTETKLTAKKFVEQACETGSFMKSRKKLITLFSCENKQKYIMLENITKLFAKMLTFAEVIITKNDRNRHQY